MNMRDAIISIQGLQRDPAGQTDRIELVTQGEYGFEDGNIRFTYPESDLTGMEGTFTTFTVSPLGVVMSREGNMTSQMVFQPGRKHYFLYETPFGSATMGVETRRLVHSLGEHGGDIEIDYDIDIEHTPLGHNVFKINVKENEYHD